MLSSLLTLLACQLLGEALRDALHLPLPGPVVGMFLLAAYLARPRTRGPRSGSSLETTAETLISHMGLLFVPAGVGLIAEAPLIAQQWLPIVVALFGSTVLSVGVTALVMHQSTRWFGRQSAQTPAVKLDDGPRC